MARGTLSSIQTQPTGFRIIRHRIPMTVFEFPLELLLLALDDVGFETLLDVSHVSRYWRTAAHRHTGFWRDIRIAGASPSAVECFLFRLSLRNTEAMRIDVDVHRFDGQDTCLREIAAAVGANLHRAEQADLVFPAALAPVVLQHLLRPAPLLRKLFLSFQGPDSSGTTILPIDLFAGHSPRLQSFSTTNVFYPAQLVPVLSSVTDIVYEQSTELELPFPEPLFLSGMKPRRLWLIVRTLPFPPATSMSEVQCAIRRLELISFPCTSTQVHLVAAFDAVLKEVPTVVLLPPVIAAAHMVMAHLGSGPLSLEMELVKPQTPYFPDFCFQFTAQVSGRPLERCFWDFTEKFSPDSGMTDTSVFYFDPIYTSRIDTLIIIGGAAWDLLASHVRVMPVCTSLKLDFSSEPVSLLSSPTAQVSFPALSQLILLPPPAVFRFAQRDDGVTVSIVADCPASCTLVLRPKGADASQDRPCRKL